MAKQRDQIRLPELPVFKKFSLALRQEYANADEILNVLDRTATRVQRLVEKAEDARRRAEAEEGFEAESEVEELAPGEDLFETPEEQFEVAGEQPAGPSPGEEPPVDAFEGEDIEFVRTIEPPREREEELTSLLGPLDTAAEPASPDDAAEAGEDWDAAYPSTDSEIESLIMPGSPRRTRRVATGTRGKTAAKPAKSRSRKKVQAPEIVRVSPRGKPVGLKKVSPGKKSAGGRKTTAKRRSNSRKRR